MTGITGTTVMIMAENDEVVSKGCGVMAIVVLLATTAAAASVISATHAETHRVTARYPRGAEILYKFGRFFISENTKKKSDRK